jgi:hypothetical protein
MHTKDMTRRWVRALLAVVICSLTALLLILPSQALGATTEPEDPEAPEAPTELMPDKEALRELMGGGIGPLVSSLVRAQAALRSGIIDDVQVFADLLAMAESAVALGMPNPMLREILNGVLSGYSPLIPGLGNGKGHFKIPGGEQEEPEPPEVEEPDEPEEPEQEMQGRQHPGKAQPEQSRRKK